MSDTVVCFDLGGVIVRICRSWEEGCARAGVEPRDQDRFMHPDQRAARHELTDRHQRGELNIDGYCDAIAGASPGLYTPDEVRRVHRAWPIDEYAGVGGLIDELNRVPGVRTACLSNTNHAHWGQMLGHELGGPVIPALRRITHRVASHEVMLAKPDEKIYRRFERDLGAEPSSIVFFDDLQENIDAATDRGWHASRIDHAADTAAQMRRFLRSLSILD